MMYCVGFDNYNSSSITLDNKSWVHSYRRLITKKISALFFTGFNCNFDKEMCGFSQSRNDKFDWSRHSGRTPSSNTGPDKDHSGSGELETRRWPSVSQALRRNELKGCTN